MIPPLASARRCRPLPRGATCIGGILALCLSPLSIADEGEPVSLRRTDTLHHLAPVRAREDILVTLPTGLMSMPIAPRNEKLRLSDELHRPLPGETPAEATAKPAVTPAGQAAEAESATPPGATLSSLLVWLDQHNPELQAMDLESLAARERIRPAGALPDPMFALELRDFALGDPAGGPGSTRYQFRQSLPLWGKRELRGQEAAAGVQSSEARRDLRRSELRARLKAAYARYVAAEEAQRVNGELRRLLQDLAGIVRVRYEMGLAQQQDALKVQTELSLLANDLVTVAAERQRAVTQINTLLARPADAPLAPPVRLRKATDRKLDAERLRAALLERNPRLAEAVAEIDARRHAQTLVEKNRYPDLTVGIAPVRAGDKFKTWELMLEVNIPLQQEVRRAQEREAMARTQASEVRRKALADELLGDFGQALASYEASRHHCHLLRHTLLPQVELTLQSALAGYQTGKVDFTALLDAHRQIHRVHLDLIQAEYESELWLVELERLVGEDL